MSLRILSHFVGGHRTLPVGRSGIVIGPRRVAAMTSRTLACARQMLAVTAVAEVIFDRTFDKWSFARATTTWSGPCAHDDDPVAAAARASGSGSLARERSPGAGAKPQAVAAGADHSQGRCRLLPDGGQARLSGARGPQGRAARGEGRPDRHEGAAVRRGRQLRRRRRRDRRKHARRRRQAARLPLARRALRDASAPRHRQDGRPAGQVDRRVVAGDAARDGGARGADARQHPAFGDQARAGGRRSRPLQRAARPAWSTPRWSPTSICRCRA